MAKNNFLLNISSTAFIILLIPFITCTSCQRKGSGAGKEQNYPILNTTPVTDDYFGKKVVDNYRILEDVTNKDVKQWFEAEKKLCDSSLQAISNRDSLHHEIENLVYSSNILTGFPQGAGEKIFFIRFFIKENVYKLFYKASVTSSEIELFNTENLNKDSLKFRIEYYVPSHDGKYLAFGLSSGGDEKVNIHIIDVEKKLLLSDLIERAVGGNPNWIPGKDGFFYQQLKEIKTDNDSKTKYEDAKVKLHFVGTEAKKDKEVFSRNLNKNLQIDKIDFPLIYTFPSSDKVLAVTNHGSQAYGTLYFSSINDIVAHLDHGTATWKIVCNQEEKVKNYALNGDELFLLTYATNPNGRLEKMKLQHPDKKEIILEKENAVLEDMIQSGDALYIKSLQNGTNNLIRVNIDDLNIKNINLPFKGSVDIKPNWEVPIAYSHSKNFYLRIESWIKERSIYYYDINTAGLVNAKIDALNSTVGTSDLIVNEIEVPSHDGVLVPLSIIHSKNIHLNNSNPTLITGYGAYGFSNNSYFDPSLLAWFHKGGVYAVAHVRGGGEKGDAWYKGGYKSTKPNSWKDFIACAEYLIKNKYTSPEKLAADGASAGGITVGRAITERPDLFKAAVISVGGLNAIRMENSSNTVNTAEFGTVKDSTEFNYVYEMDVYHHIKEGVKYPSVLFTAGMNDARVDPWIPAKAVARMQQVCRSQDNAILFRISDTGHFGNDNQVKELTDKYSFLLWQLGHPDFKSKEN